LGHDVSAPSRTRSIGCSSCACAPPIRGRREFLVNLELWQPSRCARCAKLHADLATIGRPPLVVTHNGNVDTLDSKEALLAHLMDAGRRARHPAVQGLAR
jgi:hypothetical protein